MAKKKILISDNLSEEGKLILEESGLFEVDIRKKTPREEILSIIGDYDGLIIRSATKADEELIDKAKKLKVIIRAGVGVDNINIPACSQKGIVVMNAPAGNSISTAEHAIALLFSLVRKIPAADQSMKSGQWEKNLFNGNQLTGKTIGVIGLGRIGKEVVKRALGLQMNVLGYDPYIGKEHLEHLQIDIVSKNDILKNADIITVHTPLTDQTKGIVSKKNIKNLKKGVFLINAARGGIYEEDAIVDGIEKGIIAGAALDVFSKEPLVEGSKLRNYANVILTPHLGASTDEAQTEVAKESAQSMVQFFKEGIARNSLNFPTIDPADMSILTPWFELSEKMGALSSQILDSTPKSVTLEMEGPIVQRSLKPLEYAFLKGYFQAILGDEVNLVNAPGYAQERGLVLNIITKKSSATESTMKLDIEGNQPLQIKATVNLSDPLVIEINQRPVQFRPEGNFLFIQNKDVPRVVGELGNMLGNAGINIAELRLLRDEKGGTAMTFISTDEPVTEEMITEISARDFILNARIIKL